MKKFPKKYLYYNIFISFFVSLIACFFFIIQIFLSEDPPIIDSSWMILIAIGGYILIEVFLLIIIVLRYHFMTYEIKDDLIKLKKGIIFKREINLKYEKMHAIDIKQNIIQKFFKITSLSIDSGSTTKADLAEIVIVEDDAIIKEIQDDIKARMKGISTESITNDVEIIEEKEDIIYKYNNKDKLMFVLMSSLSAIIIGILYFVFGTIFFNIFIQDFEVIETILFGSIAFFAGALFLTPVTTYLVVLIKYYDYKVIAKSDHFVITHGLITKVNHILQYKKIKGIRIEEGIIKRIFKYASIKLEVVGFGRRSTENDNTQVFNYLIPLCKMQEVQKIIESLNLDFKYVERLHRAPKNSFRYFFSLKLIIFSVVYLTLLPLLIKIPIDTTLILIGYFSIYFAILLFIHLYGILEYKNAGIYYDDVQTVIYYGAFTRVSLIVLNENITEIEVIDTYCRSKKNIASFNIHYFNNAYKNEARAHLLEKDIIEDLKSIVKY